MRCFSCSVSLMVSEQDLCSEQSWPMPICSDCLEMLVECELVRLERKRGVSVSDWEEAEICR